MSAQLSDTLEREIDHWIMRLSTAKTPDDRREAWAQIEARVKARSPQRVAEMEEERGLR